MKKRITIPNTVPHLLEALCTHPDTPAWLVDDLWDAINDRTKTLTMSATYWASQLEMVGDQTEEEAAAERERRYGYGETENSPTLQVIQGGVQ